MPNVIEEMRDRLTERFSQPFKKPIQGLRITANDMPRMPQSRIPNPKPKYDMPGRPPIKKPKDIFGGWT